ncbi:S-methyl-5-thioribose-1-phosphate isomerase [Candidatus Bathyarchaeota archaeon]|nr:S-methyl-5-thioribose-1-phosphate isomerase [Candidatus Bathyarchaeota archaeon]
MSVKDTAAQIKALKIQGATSIAVQSVKALGNDIRNLEWSHPKEVLELLNTSIATLVESRSTEPMMRNGLRYIKSKIHTTQWSTQAILRSLVQDAESEILMMFNEAKNIMIDVGARRIEDGDTILTHCHSSGVTSTLVRAHEQGKEFRVLQTETRPKFQGRLTAYELVEAGIDTIMIVDSAARHYMKEIDFVLVGADAITSEGNVINKIGTSQVALAAWEARVPFYVVSTLLKFDPVTIHGTYEAIEERDIDEIWEDPPTGLRILNPAFDVTRRDYIHGLISEEGIISPHSILEAIHRHYPWML